MKASELIRLLETKIKNKGDYNIEIRAPHFMSVGSDIKEYKRTFEIVGSENTALILEETDKSYIRTLSRVEF